MSAYGDDIAACDVCGDPECASPDCIDSALAPAPTAATPWSGRIVWLTDGIGWRHQAHGRTYYVWAPDRDRAHWTAFWDNDSGTDGNSRKGLTLGDALGCFMPSVRRMFADEIAGSDWPIVHPAIVARRRSAS